MNDYIVIGYPLAHSMSPAIHNASFEALGLPHRFGARALQRDELDAFIKALPASQIRGVAVTIPHKTAVLPYCEVRESEVEAIGAANTLLVREGILSAFNTDAPAAGLALREAGVTLHGARVVVIGAGGAARAVCYRLLHEGIASLTIANRTFPRAARLADDLRRTVRSRETVSAIPLAGEELSRALAVADILVNTTSVGMHPREDASPLPAGMLRSGLVVMDIVYNPAETRLLREAREAGAKAIPGTEMMVYQAVEQERIWLGIEAPVDVMRKALLRALGKAP